MKKPVFIELNFKKYLLFLLLSLPSYAIGQIGLQTPIPYYNLEQSDSLQIMFPTPVMPLRDWENSSDQYIKLENEGLRIDQIISPNVMPDDPFKIDTRSSSYYVPRPVRDELNLIMNRPRENAFMPVLSVAYLALQMASKYLIIKQKTEITVDDINKAREALPVLKELWKENPQTLTQLYKKKKMSDMYTMVELKRLMDMLSENKLVKPKQVERGETIYFRAIKESDYDYIIEKSAAEISPSKKNEYRPKSANDDTK